MDNKIKVSAAIIALLLVTAGYDQFDQTTPKTFSPSDLQQMVSESQGNMTYLEKEGGLLNRPVLFWEVQNDISSNNEILDCRYNPTECNFRLKLTAIRAITFTKESLYGFVQFNPASMDAPYFEKMVNLTQQMKRQVNQTTSLIPFDRNGTIDYITETTSNTEFYNKTYESLVSFPLVGYNLSRGESLNIILTFKKSPLTKWVDIGPVMFSKPHYEFAVWNSSCIYGATYTAPPSLNATNYTHFPAPFSYNTTNATLVNSTSCANIRIIDQTNITQLTYEIQNISCGTGNNTGIVLLPNASNTTNFTLVYCPLGTVDGQNAQAVWRGLGAYGVYHMENNASLIDAAGYNNININATAGFCRLNTSNPIGLGNGIQMSGNCYYGNQTATGLPTGNNNHTTIMFVRPIVYSGNKISYGVGPRLSKHEFFGTEEYVSREWYNYGGGSAYDSGITITSSLTGFADRYNGTQWKIWMNASVGNGSYTAQALSTASTNCLGIGGAACNSGLGVENRDFYEVRLYNSSLTDARVKDELAMQYWSAGPVTSEIQNTAPNIKTISVLPSPAYTNSTLRCNVTANDSEQLSLNVTFNWFRNGINQTSLAGSVNVSNNTASLISNITSGDFMAGENWSCGALASDGSLNSSFNYSLNRTLIQSCGVLNRTNTNYSLTESVSLYEATCFNITAANITLNCAGFSITGNNSTSTNGVYSNSFNSTIKNCLISNFSTGIYLNSSANYANITNNTINLTYSTSCSGTNGACNGIFFNAAKNGTITNNYVRTYQYAINLYGGATNNLIQYNNASASNFAINLYTSSNNIIQYNNATASRWYAIYLYSSSNNNISYNKASASTSHAIYLGTSSNSNISYNNLSAPSQAIHLYSSSNNNIRGNRFNSSSATSTYGTVYIDSNSDSNNFTINTINETNTGSNVEKPIYINSGKNNRFINNTIVSASTSGTPAIYAAAVSGNNTFTLNNITAGRWVNDANGTNYYNSSTQGNIYYWINGTAIWQALNGSNLMTTTPPDWSSSGYGVNASSFPTFWVGEGVDYWAWTNNSLPAVLNVSNILVIPTNPYKSTPNISCNMTAICGGNALTCNTSISWLKNNSNQTSLFRANLTIQNNTITLISNVSNGNYSKGENWSCVATTTNDSVSFISNQSANVTILNSAPIIEVQTTYADFPTTHKFNATAGITDVDGGVDITSVSITSSLGTCVQHSNLTNGNLFNVTYNCTSIVNSSTNIQITFTDASSSSVQTTSSTHTYPDHASSLTAPSITPSPAYANSTLTCNNGSYSDIDLDTENISARTWRWFRNTTLLSGQTAVILAGYFSTTDSIICEETAYNSTWTDSNKSANSSPVVISNSPPAIAAAISFTNATTGHWFYANATANDSDGGTDITSWNITTTSGTCVNYSNSTNGVNRSLVFNCSSSSSSTPILNITFIDSASSAVSTSGTNAYPDPNNSSLTKPVINNSAPFVNSLLNCTNGTFSDLDGDTENTSARTWAWYQNGVLSVGATSQTLNLTAITANVGDNISCNKSVVALNWTTSVASNQSANVTVIQAGVFGTNFSIYYPGKAASTSFICPFPTIDNIIPYGQTAKIGILRIKNNVTAVLKNYSIMLNATLPTGINSYARCDKFSVYNGTWNLLNASSGLVCLTNVNSTNLSAYMWMKVNCTNATINTTAIMFNVTEIG